MVKGPDIRPDSSHCSALALWYTKSQVWKRPILNRSGKELFAQRLTDIEKEGEVRPTRKAVRSSEENREDLDEV